MKKKFTRARRNVTREVARLPQAPPEELMRMLIPSAQAFALVVERKTAEALANATRRIGALSREGLEHLACADILVALAELELRARSISPEMIDSIRTTADAIETARNAIVAAERVHARARGQILAALGYHEEAAKLDPKSNGAAMETPT